DFTFPRELLPPAEVGFWRPYLQKRKDFGFNAVRHHSTMVTESYLAAADEIGMLVQPELPILYMEELAKTKGDALAVYRTTWGPHRDKYANAKTNKPTTVHEMANLSCLPNPAESDRFDGTIKPTWLDSMRDVVRRQHLDDVLPDMLQASWKLQASLIKHNAEM